MVKTAQKCLLKMGILGLSFSILLTPLQAKAAKRESDLTLSQQSFINKIAKHAQEVQKEHDILPSVLISQAILESNWGKSKLAQIGKNLFGVKGTYRGKSILMPTKEFIDNQWVETKADFCAYPSWHESLCDQARLFAVGTSWNKNLYAGILHEKDYKQAIKVLTLGGYSTDPAYAEKLIGLIQTFNLTKFDRKNGDEQPKGKSHLNLSGKGVAFRGKEESYESPSLLYSPHLKSVLPDPNGADAFFSEKKWYFAQQSDSIHFWKKEFGIPQFPPPLRGKGLFDLAFFSENKTSQTGPIISLIPLAS